MKYSKLFFNFSYLSFTEDIVGNPFYHVHLPGLGELDHEGFSDEDEYRIANFLYEEYGEW